jgi:DNA ligase-1
MIDKKLKTRCNAATINKVFIDLIPTFKVALANKFEQVKNVSFQNDVWFQARKFDGARVLAIVDDQGEITFYSRTKTQLFTLGKVEEVIKTLGLKSVVFDGELCKIDANGLEDFQSVMKELLKKNHTIAKPKYYIFDMLTLNEFNSCTSTRKYGHRYLNLLKTVTLDKEPVLSVVEQRKVKSESDVEEYMAYAMTKGWEGLILRKDTIYEAKRTNNMLKVKEFEDEEFKVTGVHFGDIRYIINGVDTVCHALSAVNFIMDGQYTVSVGSGFNEKERLEYGKHPEKIKGKIITVKHFGRTTDKNGKHSLRFPTFKCIHGEKRIV